MSDNNRNNNQDYLDLLGGPARQLSIADFAVGVLAI